METQRRMKRVVERNERSEPQLEMKSHRRLFTFSHEPSDILLLRDTFVCVSRDSDERLGSILTKFGTNDFGRKISIELFYRENRLCCFKMKKPCPFVFFRSDIS